MALGRPQVAIGDPNTWRDLEVVVDAQVPQLEDDEQTRPILRGAVTFRYWTQTVGVPGGGTETIRGRLLLHNAATSPPPGAVAVPVGFVRTWARLVDLAPDPVTGALSPELDPVEAGHLEVQA